MHIKIRTEYTTILLTCIPGCAPSRGSGARGGPPGGPSRRRKPPVLINFGIGMLLIVFVIWDCERLIICLSGFVLIGA